MKMPEGIVKINKLRNGEKVICTSCGKGEYKPTGDDHKKTHCFVCDSCGAKINID